MNNDKAGPPEEAGSPLEPREYQGISLTDEYLSRGWWLLPCHGIVGGRCTCANSSSCSVAGKHPRTPRGFLDASNDPAIVSSWIASFGAERINWALATGAMSGVDVVDVDPRHGGNKSLAEWTAETGRLPSTLTAITGGGGWHLYFEHVSGLRNRINLLPGVDLRADGGYVLLPPSRHVSGGVYTWR